MTQSSRLAGIDAVTIKGWCPYCESVQKVVATQAGERVSYKLEIHLLPRGYDACQGSEQEPGLRYALCEDCETSVPAVIRMVGSADQREMVMDWYPYSNWIFHAELEPHPVCNEPGLLQCTGSYGSGSFSFGIKRLRNVSARC